MRRISTPFYDFGFHIRAVSLKNGLIVGCLLIAMLDSGRVNAQVSESSDDSDRLSLSELERQFISENTVLRVAVSRISFPPYLIVENDQVSGQSLALLRSVAETIGLELEFQLYETQDEVQEALRLRKADVSPYVGITPGREEYSIFSTGITPDPAGIVGLNSGTGFLENPLMKGNRVGVVEGSPAVEFLPIQFPNANMISVSTVELALEQLVSGELHYVYGSLTDVFQIQKPELIEPLEIKQRVFYSTSWKHIAIRSDWPIVKRMIDRFIVDARKEHIENSEFMNFPSPNRMPPITLTPAETEYIGQLDALKVGADPSLPLLNGFEEGRHVGIASEFTAYLAYQLSLPVEVKQYNGVEQLLDALDTGEIDVIPYFSISEERRKKVAFSYPYLSLPWVVVGRPDQPMYWDIDSFKGKSLAIRRGHPLLPILQENYPSIEVVITNGPLIAAQEVVNGNAAATIESKFFVNRILTEHYSGKLQVLGELKNITGDFAFAVDRNNDMLIPIINKALTAMPASLSDRVIRRWIAVDFQPAKRLRSLLQILIPLLMIISVFLLLSLYWSSKVARESRQRKQAERRLVDMTDQLSTGVFQFIQVPGEQITMQFSNKVTRSMGRFKQRGTGEDSIFSLFEYIAPADRRLMVKKIRHSLRTGEAFRETFQFNFPHGEKGWILADAQSRADQDGARVWTGYLFDLSSERLLSEELNNLTLSRSDFMMMASHELRSPSQKIYSALKSIDSSVLNTKQQENILTAQLAARDLEKLVDDIIEITGLHQQTSVLSNEQFDFHDAVNSVCKTFQAAADAKNIEYSVHINDSVPQWVVGDCMRVKQIIYNVVGNAIKYTESGSVAITAGLEKKLDRPSRRPIEIKVSDTGIGIPEDRIEGIFEPFSSEGSASRRSSGLGLTLCDRLAAIMGGHISVSSIEEKGSLFTITLPLYEDREANQANLSISNQKVGCWYEESNCLLVVDDNLLVRELISSLLELEGWEVVQAESAEVALPLLEKVEFRAVVSDQQMSGMTGLELADCIRSSISAGDRRPVLIMMTGGMSRDEAAQVSGMFDALLFKPIKASQITQTIDEIVGIGKKGFAGTIN